jgi:hypothetical protein
MQMKTGYLACRNEQKSAQAFVLTGDSGGSNHEAARACRFYLDLERSIATATPPILTEWSTTTRQQLHARGDEGPGSETKRLPRREI